MFKSTIPQLICMSQGLCFPSNAYSKTTAEKAIFFKKQSAGLVVFHIRLILL